MLPGAGRAAWPRCCARSRALSQGFAYGAAASPPPALARRRRPGRAAEPRCHRPIVAAALCPSDQPPSRQMRTGRSSATLSTSHPVAQQRSHARSPCHPGATEAKRAALGQPRSTTSVPAHASRAGLLELLDERQRRGAETPFGPAGISGWHGPTDRERATRHQLCPGPARLPTARDASCPAPPSTDRVSRQQAQRQADEMPDSSTTCSRAGPLHQRAHPPQTQPTRTAARSAGKAPRQSRPTPSRVRATRRHSAAHPRVVTTTVVCVVAEDVLDPSMRRAHIATCAVVHACCSPPFWGCSVIKNSVLMTTCRCLQVNGGHSPGDSPCWATASTS